MPWKPCLEQDLRAEDATLAFGGGGGGEWKRKLAKRVWLGQSRHPHVLSDQGMPADNHSKALLQLSSLCWTPCLPLLSARSQRGQHGGVHPLAGVELDSFVVIVVSDTSGPRLQRALLLYSMHMALTDLELVMCFVGAASTHEPLSLSGQSLATVHTHTYRRLACSGFQS